MKLILAPMEGLADDILRGVLTRAGRYDWCVTEFVRVTGTLLPQELHPRQPGTAEWRAHRSRHAGAGAVDGLRSRNVSPRTPRAWPNSRRPASTSTSAARRRW
jgi:hypothetical protein